MSKPTWSNTCGCSATSAFFVLGCVGTIKELMNHVNFIEDVMASTINSGPTSAKAAKRRLHPWATPWPITPRPRSGAMASQAASGIWHESRREIWRPAGCRVGIQGLGDRLSKSAPQTGVLGNASQAVAQTVKDGGKYIEGAGLSGMTEDLAQLIRRNPIPAVLIGILLGLVRVPQTEGLNDVRRQQRSHEWRQPRFR